MNSPNETSDQFSQFPLPHFTLTPPLPNPNPNFPPIPAPNSHPYGTSPLDDHLLRFPVPKKRQRGRPRRSASTSSFQVLNFPDASFNPNIPYPNPKPNSISSSVAATIQTLQPKLAHEIIVINKESTAEALTALSAGFQADSLTEEEIDFGVVSSVGGIEQAATRRYPATMHGAFLTGLREAANMAQYAKARTAKKKIDKSPSNNAHSCASLLMDLFREPDLEFGSFSVIFGRKNVDPKSPATLRITFNEPRKKNQECSKTVQQHSNKVLFQ
ncbi:Detected protein of unknown function [Hibiscus syriacus]|uniref:Uncharacterized protein n=1 Tax=Hibiscus syriacus TaxID=106335 RepID=A0A6A3AYQ4_HIBSY|nr:Detected protein of unknown function [Hibiscus syriacus]